MNAARRDFIVALAATGASVLLPRISHADAESFESWLSLLRDEAIQKGVKPETARSLLPDTLQPLAMVQNNQKNQPEKKQDLAAYLKARVTPYNIDHGRQEMNEKRRAAWQDRAEIQIRCPAADYYVRLGNGNSVWKRYRYLSMSSRPW